MSTTQLSETCSICGGLRVGALPYRNYLDVIDDVVVNPGGALVLLKDGRQLQLGQQCDSCDESKITKFMYGAKGYICLEARSLNTQNT